MRFSNIFNKEIDRMRLNSNDMSDNNFNRNIEFVTEEYIENEVPKQYKYKSLHEAIIKAYDLFLNGNLHAIGLYDKRTKLFNGTDTLNFWDKSGNLKEIERLRNVEKELELHKRFLKDMKSEKLYEDWLDKNKK